MRILITTDTVGGVWNFTTSLCEALCAGPPRSQTHRVPHSLHSHRDEWVHHVALVSFGRAPSNPQQQWIRDMQTRHGACFQFTASDAPLEWMPDNVRTLEGAALLARISVDLQPDVLHSNQFCWGALPRTGPLDIPRVLTAHSDVLSWAEACRPHGLEPAPWLDRYRHLVQAGLDGADAIVAPTHSMLHALQTNFTQPAGDAGTTQVIPNGVNIGLSATPGNAPRQRQIVTAGRFWDEAKNLSLLQTIHSPFPILCAGEAAPPATHNVELLGTLASEALHQLFRRSEIYVCPSLYEPFGLAPLEAAACGCALVLHDIPSLREVWGDAALYFTGQASLEALLQSLWHNPHAVAEAACRATRRAAEYPASRTARLYAELYSEVAATRSTEGQLAHAI